VQPTCNAAFLSPSQHPSNGPLPSTFDIDRWQAGASTPCQAPLPSHGSFACCSNKHVHAPIHPSPCGSHSIVSYPWQARARANPPISVWFSLDCLVPMATAQVEARGRHHICSSCIFSRFRSAAGAPSGRPSLGCWHVFFSFGSHHIKLDSV
jgi:hypothetical protein